MKKNRIIFSLSVVGVLCLISLCMMISSIRNGYDYKNNSRMFGNIDDLNFINEYVLEENLRLDNKIHDKYDGHILESKNIMIDYNGNKIYINAYVFENDEWCIDYAEEVSGNNYKDIYLHNDKNLNMYRYNHVSFLNIYQREKLLVFSNEKAYVVSARIPEKKFNNFIDYFMKQLPIEVEMSY